MAHGQMEAGAKVVGRAGHAGMGLLSGVGVGQMGVAQMARGGVIFVNKPWGFPAEATTEPLPNALTRLCRPDEGGMSGFMSDTAAPPIAESASEPTSSTPGLGELKSAPLHLGQQSALPVSPEAAVLDYVPNPQAQSLYLVRFAAPEFTSLCPVTGQPDFAHLVIDYAPGATIVESKSLKLFLASFRNHPGFHEAVTVGIGQRLFAEMSPKWLRIGGYWYPRGGSPIDVFWQSDPAPAGLWVPDQGVAPYRGRG